MNIEEVRVCALSMHGVTEDMPFGDDVVVFRIGGKIFLCLWLDMEERRFAVKLRPERNEELRERYDGIRPAWHWNKRHWSDVYYTMFESLMVEDIIRESYELVLGNLPRAVRDTLSMEHRE